MPTCQHSRATRIVVHNREILEHCLECNTFFVPRVSALLLDLNRRQAESASTIWRALGIEHRHNPEGRYE